MRTSQMMRRGGWLGFCVGAALLVAARPGFAQSFSEPSTVFYGKVLGTGSEQDFLITTGQLAWTIQRSDGVRVTLRTSLFAFHDNTFSYRLNVPHSALALGLTADGNEIPLPPSPQINLHAEVKVDGQTATLLGPAGSTFTTEQLMRTATYRMDLGVNRVAVDTDGDGIPDWWEDLYGLDKQDPGDATLDANGDGISALTAYRRGMEPGHDYRVPTVLTDELLVYLSGTTAILLDTADLDSDPAQLVYTLTRLPGAGRLTLRHVVQNPQNPDAMLSLGSQFTQADVLKGRLVFDPDGSGADPGSFAVEVRDEDPAHAAASAEVGLLAYRPAAQVPAGVTSLESLRLRCHYYAMGGTVVLDGASLPPGSALANPTAGLSPAELSEYVARYGDDRPYAFVGGLGATGTITGGNCNDILIAGAEGSGALAGGPGADRFVFRSFASGRTAIADFAPAEADIIDVSAMPVVADAYVHQYLRLAQTGGVYELQTALGGQGTAFTNLAISLSGLPASAADLYDLVESGRLLVGTLRLEPMVSVTACQPQASENGPSEARFALTRRGSLDGALTVNVILTGTAQNGVDYVYVPPTVVMPEGEASAEVVITPYADGAAEPVEHVQLMVTSGAGYRVGTASQAAATIEDLLMLVSIEALEPLAVKDSGVPGVLAITRRDVIDRDVLIRLTVGGTATKGVDYTSIPSYVVMGVNQTVSLVQITPKAGAVLTGGAETVDVSITADPAYRVSGTRTGQVAIVERLDTLAAWRAREFAGSTGDVVAFASSDDGGTGISNFRRYAFGLDAHAPDAGDLPRPFLYDGQLAVTFRKPLGVTDVQYRIVGTTDLTNWTARAFTLEPMPAPDGSRDPQRVYYRVPEAVKGTGSTFTRVEAEWAP